MNGDKASITELAKILTTGPLDPNVEIVVGCPGVYISFARGLLPASIRVAGQVNIEISSLVVQFSKSFCLLECLQGQVRSIYR